MKQINSLKKLLLATCVAGSGMANAQIIEHPLAFGSFDFGGTPTKDNWYANYVGLRFEVLSPASIAGDKQYTTANDGVSTSVWGGYVSTPLVNKQIVMPQAGDSLADNPITVDMTDKIAVVYRGNNYFSDKALAAQTAGAIACVIINNIPGGPLGMAAGTSGPSVLIPVFMISKEDGDAMDALYNAHDTARVTITRWGVGAPNDLGFVPGGTAGWHSFAVPANQLNSSDVPPFAYKMIDGAFVANYGSNDASDVKLKATLTFTPNSGGGTSTIHADSLTFTGPFYADGSTNTTADSIMALFVDNEYNIGSTTVTPGRYDLTYNLIAGSFSGGGSENYTPDNTAISSFYATDSLYSKSRYDFTKNAPIRTVYESFGSTGFIWGPMYYVAKGGSAISRIQYSIASNTAGPLSDGNDLLLFKWMDGSNGEPQDSILQDGELTLVASGHYPFDGVNDTSEALLNFSALNFADPNSGNPLAQVPLDADSWYYLGIQVPASMFLGCDGVMNAYPRIYGRFMHNPGNYLDYSSIIVSDLSEVTDNPNAANTPLPAADINFVNAIDSVNYSNVKGLIPSVALIVKDTVSGTTPGAVRNVKGFSGNVSLFPVPAKDQLTVSLSLDHMSKAVTYTIIDGLGRFVSKQTHNNVTSESFNINTTSFTPGHYFLVINSEGKTISRNFVITK